MYERFRRFRNTICERHLQVTCRIFRRFSCLGPDESLPLSRKYLPSGTPDMEDQLSSDEVKGLPGAHKEESDSDDIFAKKGIELPSRLYTERGRWKSLFAVVLFSEFASGPINSWPTLEPLLVRAGVWHGPEQEWKLTFVYTLALGIATASSFLAGMLYDAVGPRALATGAALGVFVSLLGMAVSIQYQSLNWLLWICYPAASAFSSWVTTGAYAFLNLLPDSRNTVASLIAVSNVLSDSLVLLALLLCNTFGFPLSVYCIAIACLSLVASFGCLVLIPDHLTSQKVAFVIGNPDADVKSVRRKHRNSSLGDIVEVSAAETFWDVCKRSFLALKYSCVSLIWCCPGASLLFVIAYGLPAYMACNYPSLIMYPFYQDFLGTAIATSLVDYFSVINAVVGAVSLIALGRLTDYAGFERSLLYFDIPYILTFVFLCIPNFEAQLIGQVFFSVVSYMYMITGTRWVISYAPPQLFGSTMGIVSLIWGLVLMFGTPFGTMLSIFLDRLVSKSVPEYFPLLTAMGLWTILTVFFSLVYFWFMLYYPMPAPCSATMDDVFNCETKDAT